MTPISQYSIALATTTTAAAHSSLFTTIFIPIALLLLGLLVGIILTRPGKKKQPTGFALAITAAASFGAMWFGSLLYIQQISSANAFIGFSSAVNSIPIPTLFGSTVLTAIAVLIILFEVGLVGGYEYGAFTKKKQIMVQKQIQRSKVAVEKPEDAVEESHLKVTENVGSVKSLNNDERTMLEYFMFNRPGDVEPSIDVSKPGGFYYPSLADLKWDNRTLTKTMNSLAQKGILTATVSDKILTCKSCKSPKLQLKSVCPECKSLRLTKNNVIEHFECGAIEKQSAFKTSTGDLVCPKCHKKLKLIGADYRILSQMFVCQDCGALNKDLLETMKCSSCGTTANLEDESEEYAYSYKLNDNAVTRLRSQIKPVQAFIDAFQELGYKTTAPASVKGKSGANHLFDLAIKSKDGSTRDDVVVEVLISNKSIKTHELTNAYGKASDLDCDFLIFAIPGLSNNAKSYSKSFKMHVIEGSSVKDALRKATSMLSKGKGK